MPEPRQEKTLSRRHKEKKPDNGRAGRGGSPATSSLSRDKATSHYSTERHARKRKKVLRVVLITIAAVLLVGGGVAWAYLNNISSRLNDGVDSALRGQLTETTGSDPFYMLLLGVDKSEERAESSEYGAADSNYRSDSMMLVRVDPQNKQLTLVSLHRDTLMDFGENGKQKLNAAYSIGGPSYCVEQISKFAGVPISHYAEIDFDSFCSIVDQIGGIEVDVPIEIDDESYTGHLDAGLQTLNGEQALILARSRHAYDDYGDGDIYRAANQRMVIAAIVKKVLASDMATMTSTISTMADSVTTDMSLTDILSLANQFRGFDIDNNVYSGMEPTTSLYQNSTWYELCDTTAWKKMMSRVDQGLSPYENASDDPTQGLAGTADVTKNSTSSAYSGSVEVQNGTSTAGLAGTISSKISAMGFTTSADNATSADHTKTLVIYMNSAAQSNAEAIATELGSSITAEATDGTYSSTSDVLVIVGSDLA
jgi:LCP family protein required for cell wall assembly